MSGPNHTVLLLTFARRGEESAIREALALLSHSFPDAAVFAVATPVSAASLELLGVADLVIFDHTRSARRVLAEAARRKPRAAAIVYSGARPEGHLKLEFVALRSGAGRIYRCLSEGSPELVGRVHLLGSVLWKAVLTCGHLVAAAGICCAAFCWLRVAQLLAGGRRASGT